MAFDIPGTDSATSTGPFLGRIQYDTRVGFWQIVKREQGPDGRWVDDKRPPIQNPTLLWDFGSFEIGWVKLMNPPGFDLVPYGGVVPPQPAEMTRDQKGNETRAYKLGFRVKVANPELFGDSDAYHFTSNAKNVIGPVDALHKQFLASPQAAQGLVPLVKVSGAQPVKTQQSTFYSPVFEIIGWKPRLESFGQATARITPINAGPAAISSTTNMAANAAAHHAPPPNHVGPPSTSAAVPAMPGTGGW